MGGRTTASELGWRAQSSGLALLVALSCGGRVQSGCGDDCAAPSSVGGSWFGEQPSNGGDAPSAGERLPLMPTNAGGGSLESAPATTLNEADQMLLLRLEREGHGILLTSDDALALTEGACFSAGTECEIMAPHIEFVIDRGPGMKRAHAGAPARTNWDSVREMLLSVIEDLPDEASVGLSFFPPPDADECDSFPLTVPRSRLDDDEVFQRDLLLEAVEKTEPNGDSERALVDAYQAAVARLAPVDSAIVVLVTDGETDLLEGCESPSGGFAPLAHQLESRVANADVATLIVGAPGSQSTVNGVDARPFLSRVATAAKGLPCDPLFSSEYEHFDMAGEVPVAPLLTQALRSATSCWPSFGQFDLPPNADFLEERLSVRVGSETFFLNGGHASECGVGYTRDDESMWLCPETSSLLACLSTGFWSWVGVCE